MIEAMRSKAASWVAKILALLLIASFAVWGIGDMVPGINPVQNVAEIDGEPVTRNQLYERFQRVVSVMRNRFGNEFDGRQAVRLGLLDRTLDEIINARLLSLEAQRLGLDVGEDTIRQAILNDRRFQGPGNRFDRIAYESYLRSDNLTESMYVNLVREELVRRQLISAFTAANTVPKPLLNALYEYRNEQRKAEVVTVPYGDTAGVPDPDSATLQKFYDENKARFTTPEFRKVTTIYLDPDDSAANVSPPEDRIREEFESRKASASVPERRDLSQILVFSEEDIKKITKALDGGSSFEEAAEKVTGKPPQSLGKLRRSDLPGPVGEVAFGIRKGEIGEPVKSTLGWHIVRVNDVIEGREATLADLRPQIVKDLKREIAVDDIIALTAKIDDATAAGSTLEEAASRAGVSTRSFAAVDAAGNGPDGKPVKNYPQSPRFRELVASLEAGEASLIEEAGDGAYFVVRVDNITPPMVPPLDKVRAEAIQAWKTTQIQSVAEKAAREILEKAKKSGSLAEAARSQNLDVKTTKEFSRFIRDPGSPISDPLSAAVFDADKGEFVSAPGIGGYSVAKVTDVIKAQPGQNKDETEALTENLRSTLAGDIADQMIAGLRARYSVSVDQQVMQRLAEEQLGG